MNAIIGAVLAIVRTAVSILLLASVLLICANAFGRYVLLAPIIWAEEVLGYVLVWMVYLGAILVTWNHGHLRMDLLARNLHGGLGRLADGIGKLLFIAICILIIYQSFATIATFTHGSQIAGLPMDVLHAVIPGAFVLLLLFSLLRFFIKTPVGQDSDEAAKEIRP